MMVTFLFAWCIANTAIAGTVGDKLRWVKFILKLEGIDTDK
jgi:hypothetical protein